MLFNLAPLALQASLVAARVLVRVLEDLLLPRAYDADLVNTSYSLTTESTGLELDVHGLTEVVPLLLELVLKGLAGRWWLFNPKPYSPWLPPPARAMLAAMSRLVSPEGREGPLSTGMTPIWHTERRPRVLSSVPFNLPMHASPRISGPRTCPA